MKKYGDTDKADKLAGKLRIRESIKGAYQTDGDFIIFTELQIIRCSDKGKLKWKSGFHYDIISQVDLIEGKLKVKEANNEPEYYLDVNTGQVDTNLCKVYVPQTWKPTYESRMLDIVFKNKISKEEAAILLFEENKEDIENKLDCQDSFIKVYEHFEDIIKSLIVKGEPEKVAVRDYIYPAKSKKKCDLFIKFYEAAKKDIKEKKSISSQIFIPLLACVKK